ncbi:isoprenylcysteine carboxylmethyltransferase family protein [Nitrospira sp. BLG_1]|uniref:isoprenylcysteine carboxylmethyltransferase family protein n=1 Tax=Nitrospira sp. BLG_1 TaxID=3395883 RepID=UPI0039BD8069
MYLGFLFVLVGWALYLGSDLTVLFLPVFILYINRFQTESEERPLTALFGKKFALPSSRLRKNLF